MFYCLAEKRGKPLVSLACSGGRSPRILQRAVFSGNAIWALLCPSSDIQRFCSLHHGTAGGGQRGRVCVTTPTLDMGDRSSSQLLSRFYAVSSCQDTGEVGFCRIFRDIPRLTIDIRRTTRWLFQHRCFMRVGPLGGLAAFD